MIGAIGCFNGSDIERYQMDQACELYKQEKKEFSSAKFKMKFVCPEIKRTLGLFSLCMVVLIIQAVTFILTGMPRLIYTFVIPEAIAVVPILMIPHIIRVARGFLAYPEDPMRSDTSSSGSIRMSEHYYIVNDYAVFDSIHVNRIEDQVNHEVILEFPAYRTFKHRKFLSRQDGPLVLNFIYTHPNCRYIVVMRQAYLESIYYREVISLSDARLYALSIDEL